MICNCKDEKPKVFNPKIPKYKKGDPMIPNDCWECRNYGCIQTSVNGEAYWCRLCGYGGTTSYAMENSK